VEAGQPLLPKILGQADRVAMERNRRFSVDIRS